MAMFRKSLLLRLSLIGFKASGEAYEHFSALRRKCVALFLAFSIVFCSVIFPQRDARAFLVIPGIQLIVNPGTAIMLGSAATALGLTSWYLSLKNPSGSDSLHVKLNPMAPAEVPTGWTAAVNPANDPVPPSSAGAPTTNWSTSAQGQTGEGPSLAAACGALGSALNAAGGYPGHGAVVSSVPGGVNFCTLTMADTATANAPASSVLVCPTGYTNVSGNCSVTTPTAVRYPSDGKCAMKWNSGVFSYDTRDPDCDGTPPTNFIVSPDGKVITINGTSSKSVITSQSDNSIKVEQWTGNGDGTSQYTAATTSAPEGSGTGGAAVTGFSTGRVVGEGALAGAGSGAQGASGDDHCGAPGQPPCKIDETGTPTTGATAADEAKAELDAMSPLTFGKSPWDGTPAPLPGHVPTLPGSAVCVNPISWTWMGHNLTPDLCAIWAPLKGWLEWFLYAYTALYIWRRGNQAIGGG